MAANGLVPVPHCGQMSSHGEGSREVCLHCLWLPQPSNAPPGEYQRLGKPMIDEAMNILSDHYEKAYGRTAGSYNYHVVSAHLREIRAHGPLTQYSAYPFEGSYSELRRSFAAGTRKSTKH